MTKLQFRVLYREFLFRMVDLELLSADALGDSNKLLGQFAALLIFVSILCCRFPPWVPASSHTPPELRLFGAWGLEHFLIATTMLVVGLFAVLSWDSTFPDRRDVLVLAPLPVRARTLFLAKVAAAATALGLTVVFLNSVVGLVGPLALGAAGHRAGGHAGTGVSTRHAAGRCSRHRATVEARVAAGASARLGDGGRSREARRAARLRVRDRAAGFGLPNRVDHQDLHWSPAGADGCGRKGEPG